MPKVTKYCAVHTKDGDTIQLSPGDDLPEGVDAKGLNPALFEDDEIPESGDENQDAVASGPGVTGSPDETEDETEARRKTDRERKAAQRAAKKVADEAAQKAAEDREKQEADAAAKAQADAEAAAQGQGGN